MTRWGGGGLLLALAACSSVASEHGRAPQPTAAIHAPHPVSGLRVVPLTIASAGRVHRFRVEVAATPAEQERGLMFRTAMAPEEGMIFPFAPSRPASFWMKNTVIPLDLVFIAADGRIESVAANAVPYSLEPISSRGPVAAVLEINGGRAGALGIAAGDRVAWQLAPPPAGP